MNEQTAGWLDKAQESLSAAQVLNASGFPSEAISRAYYAMFYAAKALTLTTGIGSTLGALALAVG